LSNTDIPNIDRIIQFKNLRALLMKVYFLNILRIILIKVNFIKMLLNAIKISVILFNGE